MEMRKKLTSGEKPQKIRRIEEKPSTSKQNQKSNDFSDDDDFATQCYIIDLKTELKEKDAQILKLKKKVDKLERRQASSWNFNVNFSDSDQNIRKKQSQKTDKTMSHTDKKTTRYYYE